MKIIFLGLFFSFWTFTFYPQELTKNPFYSYLENYSDSELTIHDLTLLKASVDFNNDGIIDIATSDESFRGNAGAQWLLYLGLGNSKYKYIGDIFFHPLAFKIIPIKFGISKLIMYSRYDAGSGHLVEYQITKSGVKEIKSTYIQLNNNLNDRKKYKKLFDYLTLNPIVACCKLSEYKRNKNCKWHPGYYLK